MKKIHITIVSLGLLLQACSSSDPAPTVVETPTGISIAEGPSSTPEAVTPTITPQPEIGDRPVFLRWPLPAQIGLARISQFPNSPWTWKYLGLNEGQQCPPMFGYLLNVDSWVYWRDLRPEHQLAFAF